MNVHKLARILFTALCILALRCSSAIPLSLSKREGDQLQRKINEISKNASKSPVPPKKIPVTETELNSYLAFNLKEKIPRGLTNPQVSIVGDGRLAGRVDVDLDEFKQHRQSGGFMDPLSYLSGRVPVTARGILRTHDGQGRFQLRSAEILGVPLPEPVLQEIVSFFSSTPEHPRGFDLDGPFNLPAKIRELTINRGEAIVLQ